MEIPRPEYRSRTRQIDAYDDSNGINRGRHICAPIYIHITYNAAARARTSYDERLHYAPGVLRGLHTQRYCDELLHRESLPRLSFCASTTATTRRRKNRLYIRADFALGENYNFS